MGVYAVTQAHRRPTTADNEERSKSESLRRHTMLDVVCVYLGYWSTICVWSRLAVVLVVAVVLFAVVL